MGSTNHSDKMKEIAVVILNWNGKDLLNTFLPDLIQHSGRAKIYVIDNDSTDDSVAFLQTHFPQVTIIQNKKNTGYAGGYNIGLQQVNEPIYCLINSDVLVSDGWLNPVLDLFGKQPEIGIIQPKILDYKRKDYFEYAGAGGGFIDAFGFPYCRGRIFDVIEKDEGQYDDTLPVFWVSGACLFVRKNIFEQLGGFDEAFFAHQEEIDFCWRAYLQNIQVYYCGSSTVYHVGGATLSNSSPKKTFLNFRNSLLMLYKNRPQKGKFLTIFIRLCLDGIAGIRFLLLGQPKHCWAIVRSHFAFYGLIRQSKVSRNNRKYYTVRSIVWEYFVRRKRNYHQIKSP